MSVICPYCENPAELVSGKEIYPHRQDLYSKKFWSCEPCGAYVGCHGSGSKPLGIPANAELRSARLQAHRAFDSLWKKRKWKCARQKAQRSQAYRWLADFLELETSKCHIGMFDVDQCRAAVAACKQMRGRSSE